MFNCKFLSIQKILFLDALLLFNILYTDTIDSLQCQVRDDTDYPWKVLPRSCSRTDDVRLLKKVDAAQAAIDARLYELSSDGKTAGQELIALRDAQKGLTVLRKERELPSSSGRERLWMLLTGVADPTLYDRRAARSLASFSG